MGKGAQGLCTISFGATMVQQKEITKLLFRSGSRRPSVVDITAKGGGTGRWSKRNSLAGNEFLKMEDEVRACY